jgi:hypothetical protein
MIASHMAVIAFYLPPQGAREVYRANLRGAEYYQQRLVEA